MSDIMLSVQDLKVSYGAIKAVRGISFEIRKGEIVSLIGGNGAGKSTTLRAISGLQESTGEILFAGRSIRESQPHRLVENGLIHAPEGRGIFLNLTVEENLKLGAFARKGSFNLRAEFEECFKLFPRIKERFSASAGTLSGGEQQMLAICRALVAKPKLLMLDEPSLGLAPMVVQQIFSIIKKLNQDGITILLVEQNARMALKVAHRAYVLETGTITLTGPGQELLDDPQIQKAYLGH
jgi:branched-chain amino acid transport system ATP-binding protein